MVQSFANAAISNFFYYEKVPRKAGWASVKNIARRKLTMLNAAQSVSDLKSPPGNKLESLKADLKGYYSIRINDQWRVIFKWNRKDNGPTEVNIVDYHK